MSTGKPSPSGARLAGDDFQHAITWMHALKTLREQDEVTRIEFEAGSAGNVDDLIVHRARQPALYHQIKFARTQGELLDHDWFVTVPSGAKKSPLQRFHASSQRLAVDGRLPDMVLYTNRQIAHNDPILRHLDGVTDKLVPRLMQPSDRSGAGLARTAWAEHLGIEPDQLARLLEALRIKAGRSSLDELCDTCGMLMQAVGLRGDSDAVLLGVAAIRALVIAGCRELTADAVRQIIADKKLAAGQRRATLLIQAIDRAAWPEGSTAHVDWVDLFEGTEPRQRRRALDPDCWEARMKPELRAATQTIKDTGYKNVQLAGAYRLSTGFLVGTELPRTAGFTLTVPTATGIWSSEGDRPDVPIKTAEYELGLGTDAAVGISITGDLSEDVLAYIRERSMPVGRFYNVMLADGLGQNALVDDAHARGWAEAALTEIRTLTKTGVATIHLFFFGPNGAAVLLGSIWNRMPRTQLYDDLGPGNGYAPSFEVL